MVQVEVTCKICTHTYRIQITEEQHDLLLDRKNHIQDILPEHSADERELLISSICGSCFDNIFSESEV